MLSHSEWAQRVASGLERRPRQNGAGATPQWDRTGDYHKGKIPCEFTFVPINSPTILPPQKCTDLTFSH